MLPARAPILTPSALLMRRRRSLVAQAWSPLSLFAAGEQGGWYDPTDLTTMFQDSAGATPVTAVEQPVGLWLDKRLGALSALGTELAGGTSGWVFFSAGNTTANVTQSGQTLTFTPSAGSPGWVTRQITGLTVGRTYAVSVTITAASSGTNNWFRGGNGIGNQANFDVSNPSIGSQTFRVFTATDTSVFLSVGCFTGQSISFLPPSVREVPGNHLIQPTSASRPTYSKRYNVLERTQEFANAYWDKTRTTVSSATDPSGGLTAWKLVNDTTPASSHQIRRTVTVVSGQSYTVRFLAKAAEYSFVRFWEDATTGNQCYFDLVNGVATNAGVSSCSMSSAGNGWWVCTAVLNNFGGTAFGYRINLTPDGVTTNYNGDGVSGVFLSWPDLRRTIHTQMGMPAYQRVTTATDYDETGFLPRLRFDGADDSMYSAASVDFSASDEVTVLTGLTKLSDAAQGMVYELSADLSANNGTFYLLAPGSTGGATYRNGSRGTVSEVALTAASFPAPRTDVLTHLADISADRNDLRVNGAVAKTGTGDQGTGNYGNYVLFMGRRNNAALAFNGDIFQLIVRGALTSGADLTSAEQYVAARTGVTL